jgi:TolA-binding protein
MSTRNAIKIYDATLNAALEQLGAATFGSLNRRIERLNRFQELEEQRYNECQELIAARARATSRCRSNRAGAGYDGPALRTRSRTAAPEPAPTPRAAPAPPTDGPATRTRSRRDCPAARTRSKC